MFFFSFMEGSYNSTMFAAREVGYANELTL